MPGPKLLQRAQPVVDAGVDLDHVEPLLQELDRRQKPLALQAVRPQPVRRIVGRHHEHDAVLEQRSQQPAENHRVGDVGHVKLVEADEAPAARDALRHDRERILLAFQPREILVDVAHERMEMDARLPADGDGREESRP